VPARRTRPEQQRGLLLAKRTSPHDRGIARMPLAMEAVVVSSSSKAAGEWPRPVS